MKKYESHLSTGVISTRTFLVDEEEYIVQLAPLYDERGNAKHTVARVYSGAAGSFRLLLTAEVRKLTDIRVTAIGPDFYLCRSQPERFSVIFDCIEQACFCNGLHRDVSVETALQEYPDFLWFKCPNDDVITVMDVSALAFKRFIQELAMVKNPQILLRENVSMRKIGDDVLWDTLVYLQQVREGEPTEIFLGYSNHHRLPEYRDVGSTVVIK